MSRFFTTILVQRLLSTLFGCALLCGLLPGCRPSPAAPLANPNNGNSPARDANSSPPTQAALRVLVIDDPELARAIERQWTAHGENPLTIRQITPTELADPNLKRLASDVVIYPSALMGDLAGRNWLQPLTEQEITRPDFQFRDIWEAIRLHEIKWGSETIAVPLGSPVMIFCYRSDIFERLNLSSPATWSEYEELVKRLSSFETLKEPAGTAPSDWKATYEPYAKGWAAELLLARAASYARHPSQFSTLFDYSSLRPLIDGPPFVRALTELVAAAHASSTNSIDWQSVRKIQDPRHVWQSLLGGNCAMAITWPVASDAGAAKQPPLNLGFAPLPGPRDIFNFRTSTWEQRSSGEDSHIPLLATSGRLGSATKECRNLSAAFKLLLFLSSPELSAQLASSSKHTTLFRESHLSQVTKFMGSSFAQDTAQRYGETVKQVLNQPNCLITLRIPSRQRYMTVLDDAVAQALAGQQTPQELLTGVAKQWEAITEKLGREAQQKAYKQSIGLEL